MTSLGYNLLFFIHFFSPLSFSLAMLLLMSIESENDVKSEVAHEVQDQVLNDNKSLKTSETINYDDV